MFRTSVHIDLLYTEYPYKERFSLARRDGFHAVEFYIEGWESKNLLQIRKLLDDNKLEVSAATGATPFSMCDPFQKNNYVNYFKKLLDACQVIRCPMLMCHSDLLDPETNYAAKILPKEYSFARKFCAMYDVLKTIAPLAAQANVTITVEPLSQAAHPGYFLHDFSTCVDLIRAVNEPNVKCLFDCYHTYIEEGNLSANLTKYIKDIGHIHVADAPGRHEPGSGDINYRGVLSTISKLPYDGYVSFEFYPSRNTANAIETVKSVMDKVCNNGRL
jgi:hydroxypyruvate isomerase